MRQLLIVLAIILFGLSSCKEEDIPSIPTTSEQTVFMYMPWSTNLTSYFRTNIADFETAIKQRGLKNERVVVFFATSPTEATLFELVYDKGVSTRKQFKSYSTAAFTTSNGITSLLNDVQSYAPAVRYSMIISCHGMGWLPVTPTSKTRMKSQKFHWEYEGVPLTRYFGGLTSEFQTDITTLAEGISGAGIKMEYILFDDCYLSSVEVAYDLKDVTDYLIASPTEVMAFGMPYAVIGKYLLGNVDYYGIANDFLTFYQNYIYPYGTIAVTDCSELDDLASVMKEINKQYTFDTSLLNNIQRMDGYSPVIFFDMEDYVSQLCQDDELLARFKEQLDRTVPPKYRMHTKTFYSASSGEMPLRTYSGITISDPSVNVLASTKVRTAWYKATHE